MRRSAAVAVAALLAAGPLWAATAPADGAESDAAPADGAGAQPARVFDRVLVTGGPERVADTPGSAHYLTAERLEEQQYSDIHRLLREIPGINVQEEEGYGLRPNIGMRGSGVDRSSKITLLEDGVLIAPAPYAAPAAYYFPTTGRMEAVEVRKGSSAVRQGPFTLGGVLNLVSTAIPAGRAGRLSLSLGDDGSGRLHANAGGSGERFGWLLETYQLEGDGFKRLDGGGATGVELADYLAKLRWSGASGGRWQQTAELKLGHTDQLANETYLGLTLDDFRRTPLRRYAASAADYLDSEHDQLQLRYLVQASRRVDVTATLYRNRFARNWHKLQSVEGVGLSSVLAEPGRFPDELAALRGERDLAGGGLAVRNNRRDYLSRGFEAVVGFAAGDRIAHRLELGLRLHEDEEDRFQEEDQWNITGGRMSLLEPGRPGSQANRVTGARVRAVYLQDEIRAGRWSLAPGVRYERIEFERLDFAASDPDRRSQPRAVRNSVDVLIPGVGLTYRLGRGWQLLAGAYKGFAPPGAGRDGATRAEESFNLEAGFRYRGRQLRAELVAFHNDYDNLLGRDTLSAGGSGSGELFNGGAVLVQGLEASLERTWRVGQAVVPVRLTYTQTEGEFLTSFSSQFADWGPRVTAGDRLPYLPAHQLLLSGGLSRGAWGAHLSLSYASAMRTEPGRGPLVEASSTGEHALVDLSLERRLGADWRLFARVRNLADETYVVALRPAGARPGLPRTVMVGATWRF